MTNGEHLLHLRHLCEALKLIADAAREDSEHVTNAIYVLADTMLVHLEALEGKGCLPPP
jgi:hypothetical protein